MKKFVVVLLAVGLWGFSAQATEMFRSTDELPDNAGIEAMWDVQSAGLRCPDGYVVAKKYCWSYPNKAFVPCGNFCAKHPAPPRSNPHDQP